MSSELEKAKHYLSWVQIWAISNTINIYYYMVLLMAHFWAHTIFPLKKIYTMFEMSIITLLSSIMPPEEIVNKLKEAIEKYQEKILINAPKEHIENEKKTMELYMAVWMIRAKTDGNVSKTKEFLQELEQAKKAKDMLNPNKN